MFCGSEVFSGGASALLSASLCPPTLLAEYKGELAIAVQELRKDRHFVLASVSLLTRPY